MQAEPGGPGFVIVVAHGKCRDQSILDKRVAKLRLQTEWPCIKPGVVRIVSQGKRDCTIVMMFDRPGLLPTDAVDRMEMMRKIVIELVIASLPAKAAVRNSIGIRKQRKAAEAACVVRFDRIVCQLAKDWTPGLCEIDDRTPDTWPDPKNEILVPTSE